MIVSPIRTEADNCAAIMILDFWLNVWDDNDEPYDAVMADAHLKITVLSTLISEFEAVHYPIIT